MRQINKRAQFFSLYLVLLTLFFMGVVIFMAMSLGNSVESRLVSSQEILDSVDEKVIFEMQEDLLVRSCVSENYLSENFLEDFKECFFNRILRIPESPFVDPYYSKFSFGELEFRNFLSEGVIIDGAIISSSALDSSEEWENYLKTLYEFEFENSLLNISRREITKEKLLITRFGEERVIPISMDYSFSRNFSFNISEIVILELSDEEISECDASSFISISCPDYWEWEIQSFGGPYPGGSDTATREFVENYREELLLAIQKKGISAAIEEYSSYDYYSQCDLNGWAYDKYVNGRCSNPYLLSTPYLPSTFELDINNIFPIRC